MIFNKEMNNDILCPFRFHIESARYNKYRYLYELFPAEIVENILSYIEEYDIRDISEKEEKEEEFNFEEEDYMSDDDYLFGLYEYEERKELYDNEYYPSKYHLEY